MVRITGNASGITETKKDARINFITSTELDQKIASVASEIGVTKSEFIREAVKEYISRVEKERLRTELEAGYKANYAFDAQLNEEWEVADAE